MFWSASSFHKLTLGHRFTVPVRHTPAPVTTNCSSVSVCLVPSRDKRVTNGLISCGPSCPHRLSQWKDRCPVLPVPAIIVRHQLSTGRICCRHMLHVAPTRDSRVERRFARSAAPFEARLSTGLVCTLSLGTVSFSLPADGVHEVLTGRLAISQPSEDLQGRCACTLGS